MLTALALFILQLRLSLHFSKSLLTPGSWVVSSPWHFSQRAVVSGTPQITLPLQARQLRGAGFFGTLLGVCSSFTRTCVELIDVTRRI